MIRASAVHRQLGVGWRVYASVPGVRVETARQRAYRWKHEESPDSNDGHTPTRTCRVRVRRVVVLEVAVVIARQQRVSALHAKSHTGPPWSLRR